MMKKFAEFLVGTVCIMFITVAFISCSGTNKDKCAESQMQTDFWELHSTPTPEHLSLAVSRNGAMYFLSSDEFQNLADSLASGMEILGVVVDASDVDIRFIIALEDFDNGKLISKEEALSKYGKDRPDKDESDLILHYFNEISDAIVRFGGTALNLNKERGKDVWWTEDGNIYGNVDIRWDYSGYKAKARKTITLYNPYTGVILDGQKSSAKKR